MQETSNQLMLRLRPCLAWGVSAFFASGSLLLLSQVLQAPSQVSPPANEVSGTLADRVPGEVLTEVELYFGLSKPSGGRVSETEWQNFLDREIAPRFKDGLTVLSGRGQYQGSSRTLVKENIKVVVLIYQNNPQKEMDIKAIIDAYKQAFQQESVLRTTNLVKAAF